MPAPTLILKNMVRCHNGLHEYEISERILTEIVDNTKANQKDFEASRVELYEAYDNLINHCLRYNLFRGIKILKALMADKESSKIPHKYRKMFNMYLGTGYLLAGRYFDSKYKLFECLKDDPSP